MSPEVAAVLANPDLACEFMERIGTAKIASPWINGKRYVVGRMNGHFPVIAAMYTGLIETYACDVSDPWERAYLPTKAEAEAWCDERLAAAGWLLAGKG